MTLELIEKVLFGGGAAVLTMLVATVGWFLRLTLGEIRAVQRELTALRLELARDYVRHDELTQVRTVTETLRSELNDLRERMAVVEVGEV